MTESETSRFQFCPVVVENKLILVYPENELIVLKECPFKILLIQLPVGHQLLWERFCDQGIGIEQGSSEILFRFKGWLAWPKLMLIVKELPRRRKFMTLYFATALDCDTPILEAFYHATRFEQYARWIDCECSHCLRAMLYQESRSLSLCKSGAPHVNTIDKCIPSIEPQDVELIRQETQKSLWRINVALYKARLDIVTAIQLLTAQ